MASILKETEERQEARERALKDGDQAVRIRLGMVKVAVPLMIALIANPARPETPAPPEAIALDDEDGGNDEMYAAVDNQLFAMGDLLDQAIEIGDRMAIQAGVTVDMAARMPWVRRTTAQLAAEVVAEARRHNTPVEEVARLCEGAVSRLGDLSLKPEWLDGFENDVPKDRLVALRMTYLDIAAEIAAATVRFAVLRDPVSTAVKATEYVADLAGRMAMRLLPEQSTTPVARLQMHQGLAKAFAQVFIARYTSEAQKELARLRKLSPEQRHAYMAEHPHGLPLDGVLRDVALWAGSLSGMIAKVRLPDFVVDAKAGPTPA